MTYRDNQPSDYDATALGEVIEHLDTPWLAVPERAVFKFAQARLCGDHHAQR